MSNRRTTLIAGLALLVAGGAVAATLGFRAGAETAVPADTDPADTVAVTDLDLQIAVDESLIPDLDAVPGVEDGDDPRPVGRIVYGDGDTADLVLGELIVAVTGDAQLQGFLQRHKGQLVDSFPGEDGEPDEHLVVVPLVEVDPAEVAAVLGEVEEGHEGDYEVSDPLLLTMLYIAATEERDHGIEVALNWLSSPAGIMDGKIEDAPNVGNPFNWSYMKIGGPIDTGVAGAWQLILDHGKIGNRVKVLVADGGFFENPDLPETRAIRYGSWGEANHHGCSGGNECPWHGTDVALTALGAVGNGYGTAGVAGQVGTLIAVGNQYDFWTQLRRIKRVVDDDRPAVVNMSFGWEVKTFRKASESSTDRHLRAMKNDGALVFASAGNEGKNVDQEICVSGNCYENRLTIPCESRYAICVGGYHWTTGWLDKDSNYGPKGGGRSVQIYGPYCVYTSWNPVNPSVKEVRSACGTSFSSPFVAGVAALVKAADPSLGPDQIWEIMRSTAHVGGLHFPHHIATDNQVRVNALGAVMKALGVEKTPPKVTITAPGNGFETGITEMYELMGTAVDFKGQPLDIIWESSIDGQIGTGKGSMAVFEPSAGTHTITARATDVFGTEGLASITVEVIDMPPVMSIAWPTANSLFYESEVLTLVGLSLDPDTNGPVRDWDVEWEIRQNGQIKYGATGHTAEVPAGTLAPGKYQVVFSGHDGGGSGETEIGITVLKVVGNLPKAHITTVFQDGPYGYGGGPGVKFNLTGTGTDIEDGLLPGTRFRWLATADTGHVEVLCTGSSFKEPTEPEDFDPGFVIVPPSGPVLPPVLGTINDCKSVEVELGLAPGAIGQTKWAIVLEVSDSDGQVGRDVEEILILFAVG